MQFEDRLRRAESLASPERTWVYDEPRTPRDKQLERRRASLLASMAPEHQKHIEEIARRYHEMLESEGSDRKAVHALLRSRLYMTFVDLIDADGPAVLPPHVAQIYLEDKHAHAYHDCDTCGFRVPIRTGDYNRAPKTYFERCPLEGCNGRTGWYAYFQKHGHAPPDPAQESAAPTVNRGCLRRGKLVLETYDFERR